uniref:Uncharacterized protein n=1 Tax=Pristionchus pacificus TaxID=54126 RepID=A0A2A6C7C4_PRIPA|eukprot:PDM73968.1 hypothetical protein PRIPAC_41324 [Pristionchus pacificus]
MVRECGSVQTLEKCPETMRGLVDQVAQSALVVNLNESCGTTRPKQRANAEIRRLPKQEATMLLSKMD